MPHMRQFIQMDYTCSVLVHYSVIVDEHYRFCMRRPPSIEARHVWVCVWVENAGCDVSIEPSTTLPVSIHKMKIHYAIISHIFAIRFSPPLPLPTMLNTNSSTESLSHTVFLRPSWVALSTLGLYAFHLYGNWTLATGWFSMDATALNARIQAYFHTFFENLM